MFSLSNYLNSIQATYLTHMLLCWSYIYVIINRHNIILKPILIKMGYEVGDWINLAHDGVKWRAVVNTIISLHVSCRRENFLTRWATNSFFKKFFTHLSNYLHIVHVFVSYTWLLKLIFNIYVHQMFIMSGVRLYRRFFRNEKYLS
jgi:hypothetical protein